MNNFLPPSRSPITSISMVAQDSSNLTAGEIWAVLRRHRWLVISSIVISTSLAAAYTALAPRIFEGTAAIRIEEEQLNLPDLIRRLSIENAVSTEMEVLQGRELATEVIDSLKLRVNMVRPSGVSRDSLLGGLVISPSATPTEYHLFRDSDGAFTVRDTAGGLSLLIPRDSIVHLAGISFVLMPTAATYDEVVVRVVSVDQALEDFQGMTAVKRPTRDANIVTVSHWSTDPQLASRVPNLLAALFIANRQDVQKSQARSTVKFLRQQLDTMASQLALAEDSVRRFRERAHVISLPQEAGTQVQKLMEMKAERATLEAERGALATLLGEVTKAQSELPAGVPSSYRRLIGFPTLLRNQATSELLRSLASLEDQRAELLMRKTPNDPDVRVLTDRIGQVDSQLHSIGTTYLEGLGNQVAALDSSLSLFQSELQRIPAKEVEYTRLVRVSSVLDQMYTLLQTRLKEAEVTQAVEDPSVRVVDRATVPAEPVSPKAVLNLAIGLFAGLIFGAGAAPIVERRNRSVRSRADVSGVTGTPVLGLIPRMPGISIRGNRIRAGLHAKAPPEQDAREDLVAGWRRKSHHKGNPRSTNVLARLGSRSVAADAFGRLWTNIQFSRPEGRIGALLLTSPMSGDGKTTSAAGLAITLAAQGYRTLLVDADLRRGVVNRIFGLSRTPGLTEVLARSRELHAAVRLVEQASGGTLHVLTTGTLPPNPSALLAPERIRPLFDLLREEYEAIIIDSPPLNAVGDAALIAAITDGVIVVVRAGVTAVEALTITMEQLTTTRAAVIGAVLNDIDFDKDAVYDSAYRYYGHDASYYATSE